MKRIDDGRLYFFAGIITAAIALILAVVSFYSILFVEPGIKKYLDAADNFNDNYQEAYLILRSPQIFAEYKNFDADGISVKKSINYFDKKIYAGEEILQTDKAYLELLLDRRALGSRLGRTTMGYCILLSLLSWLAFWHEKWRLSKSSG